MKSLFYFISITTLFVIISSSLFASGTGETEQAPAQKIEYTEQQKIETRTDNSKSMLLKKDFDNAVREQDLIKALDVWQIAKDYMLESDNEDISETFDFIENTINDYFSDISFEKISAPAPTIKGKSFKSSFSVRIVSKENKVNPLKLKYSVTYPSVDAEGKKITTTKILEPAEDGTVEFMSPVLDYAVSSFATFKLDIPPNVYENFENAPSIDLPFLVATNMKSSGGSISIVDFSKAGKPITSNSETSSAVLTELIKKGFTRIGNCDFVNEVVSKNDAAVQRSAVELFGKSVTYLIYGTVKYETIEKTENGIHVILKAELKVRNILQNKELLFTTVLSEATEKTEWAAINAARKKLALLTSDKILYGM